MRYSTVWEFITVFRCMCITDSHDTHVSPFLLSLLRYHTKHLVVPSGIFFALTFFPWMSFNRCAKGTTTLIISFVLRNQTKIRVFSKKKKKNYQTVKHINLMFLGFLTLILQHAKWKATAFPLLNHPSFLRGKDTIIDLRMILNTRAFEGWVERERERGVTASVLIL